MLTRRDSQGALPRLEEMGRAGRRDVCRKSVCGLHQGVWRRAHDDHGAGAGCELARHDQHLQLHDARLDVREVSRERRWCLFDRHRRLILSIRVTLIHLPQPRAAVAVPHSVEAMADIPVALTWGGLVPPEMGNAEVGGVNHSSRKQVLTWT